MMGTWMNGETIMVMHIVGCDSSRKRKEVLIHATQWGNPEAIILREKS
jgi:hypothetical protein